MTRASAIYNQIKKEIDVLLGQGKTSGEVASLFANRSLDDYYTEGVGSGTPYQNFTSFGLATTGSTKIDESVDNSALQGDTRTHDTGDAPPNQAPWLSNDGFKWRRA